MYKIVYAKGVANDLRCLRAHHRGRILEEIEVQLTHEATRQTRNRKIVVGLVPPWDQVNPVWELRLGEYRVFYDVDEMESTVTIRAIRHKPPHKRTEEIL